MSEVEHKPSATAYCNGDFILIATCSGYRSYSLDPDVHQYFFPMDVCDEEVGQAVLSALASSRQVSVEEIATFFDFDRAMRSYDGWVADLMRRYSYKSKRALFKGMKNCGIQRTGEVIRFEPMRQIKLESWEGTAMEGADDVVILGERSPREIGAAFRTALSRCS